MFDISGKAMFITLLKRTKVSDIPIFIHITILCILMYLTKQICIENVERNNEDDLTVLFRSIFQYE